MSTPSQHSFTLSKKVDMIVTPNSCFSMLYVNPSYHLIEKESKVELNLPNLNLKEVREGRWEALEYSVNAILQNGTKVQQTAVVKTFLTNNNITHNMEGFIGTSSCGEGLRDYEFGYQLLSEDIHSIRFMDRSQAHNKGLPDIMDGFLLVNENDTWTDVDLSSTNFGKRSSLI